MSNKLCDPAPSDPIDELEEIIKAELETKKAILSHESIGAGQILNGMKE